MNEEEADQVGATTTAGPGDPPTSAPIVEPTARKVLTRSRSNRMLGGVAGGLGEYFGTDPILVRLGFAVLTLFAGAGLALYIAAWVLIPEEGEVSSIGEVALAKSKAHVGDDNSWLWIAGLVVVVIVVSNIGGIGWNRGAWFWSWLLIAGGIWLYYQDRSREKAEVTEVQPPSATTPPMSDAAGSRSQATYPARPVVPRAPAPPKAPPSRLGRYTFAMMLVVLGLAALMDNAGVLELGGAEYAALALTILGAGLVVGSVWGRARGMIFWGLVLLPFVMIGNRVDLPFAGGAGERTFMPTSAAGLPEKSELFAGNIIFDLTQMAWGEEPVTVEANLFMGQIEVLVPEGVDVDFRGQAQMGQVNMFDRTREGTSVNLNVRDEVAGGPRLLLETNVFMGQINVNRSGTPAKELS